MDKKSNSTTVPKSLGELTENIVDGLAAGSEDRWPTATKLRRLCREVSELLDHPDAGRFDYIYIRGAKAAGKAAVMMGFDIQQPDSIDTLFREWVSVRDDINDTVKSIPQAETDRKMARYEDLQERITLMTPTSARELSMLFYVETTAGLSDYREEFMSRVFALCGMENNNVVEAVQ